MKKGIKISEEDAENIYVARKQEEYALEQAQKKLEQEAKNETRK